MRGRPAIAVLLTILLAAAGALAPLRSPGQAPQVPDHAQPELPPLTAEPEPAATPEPELPPLTATPEPAPSATPEAELPPLTATPEPARAEAEATPAPTPAPTALAAQAVSVCHYTGSTTAPYVLVQAPAGGGEHAAHADDIIPSPPGGCPATYQGQQPRPTPTPSPTPAPEPSNEVTLCHATGTAATPYVELTVLRSRVRDHERHRRDIIPAPEGGCPTRAAQAPDDEPDQVPPPTEPEPGPEPAAPTPRPPAAPQPAAATATPVPSPAAAEPVAVSGLANTGNRSGLAFMFGLGLMSTGAGLRLLSPRP